MRARTLPASTWSASGRCTPRRRLVAFNTERDGKDFSPSYVMLDIAQDPFMAHVYRTSFIIARMGGR
jgi:hypothetical protein